MRSNEELVDSLIKKGYLESPEVIEAFLKVDRADFVLPEYKNQAYEDHPLPIGFGQTISQPLTVAFMFEKLAPRKGENILEIGTGSGWVAGLLSYIAGNKGRVVSIERISELSKLSEKNLLKYGFKERGILELVFGDGAKGYGSKSPYDKIIAGASGRGLPQAWRRQLKVGGRIVAPVRTSILVFDKIGEDKFKEEEYPGFAFVPLVTN